jgi:predicted nucleic acid-binding Zn ribbon protein
MDDDPRLLGDVMDGVVRSLRGGAGPSSRAVGGVFGRWDEIVGPTVAANVRPLRLEQRALVVVVSDPAWATQVRLLSDELRRRIAEHVAVSVDAIEVRVAPLARRR